MATLYDAKPRFQAKLRPLVRYLAWRGATANGIILAALVLSLAYGALIAASGGPSTALLGLPAVLLIRMALNAIAGMLAREHGQASALGARLNEIGDVVSDAALYCRSPWCSSRAGPSRSPSSPGFSPSSPGSSPSPTAASAVTTVPSARPTAPRSSGSRRRPAL